MSRGPKPSVNNVFITLRKAVRQLGEISLTEQQTKVVSNLSAGIDTIAPLWGAAAVTGKLKQPIYDNPPLPPATPELSPFDAGYQSYPVGNCPLMADSLEADQWWQGYAAKDQEIMAADQPTE